ncbi:acyltransferase [Novosphingobium resinovorum]|uniref:acyltransferase family protein n=1 Tax=Novosphingobium resinovorum TaxID=158500 RepID=UPI002ED48A54|nr:acyltransferase [Novosphingobium resinovorum]
MSTASASRGLRNRPVYGLDLVRFIAAGLVVFYHLGFKAWALEGSSLYRVLAAPDAFPPGYRFTWCGWVGVQVFFVVSGAVIAYSAQGVRARRFARRRVARLLPALLIAIALVWPVTIALFAVAPAKATVLALKTMAFVPWGPWIIGQFWTIPIELAFYAVICAILASRAPPAVMRGLAWGLGIAATAYWCAVAGGWIAAGGRLSELLLLQHGGYFALGMLCARLGEGDLAWRHLLLAAACAGAAMIQVRTAAGWEMAGRPDLAGEWLQAYALWLVLTASVAASFAWRGPIADQVGRLAGALRLLGLSTYPLYLIHIHLGGAILMAMRAWGLVWSVPCAIAGSILGALVVAAWLEPPVHAVVDAALRRLGHRSINALRTS